MTLDRSGTWQDLTTEDFAGLDPERTIALLPVGAVEQHGPHLPLVTDTCILEGIVARTLELLPASARVLVLPTQAVGDSAEHGGFAGTLSLSPETLIRAWSELGAAVRRAGLRKLVMLNSHGGQPQVVDIVAQKLRLEHAMLAVKVNSFALGTPGGLFDGEELRHGIHGGALETSLMLHLRPDLVRREALADFDSLAARWAREGRTLGVERPAGVGWMAQDLNPAGACGNAAAADATRGAKLLDHLASQLLAVVRELADTPLSTLRNRGA